jgi:hypothetical protein
MADLRRASWRAWRRARPFWGGLLLAVAGLELIGIPLSGVLSHGAVKLVIYIGIGGVFGVLIGVLLIACGLAVWLNPGHRVFYGIAGVLLGILSFPASNLGGFFIGMLLAIAGGSMAFAWTLTDEPLPAAPGQPLRGPLPRGPLDGDFEGEFDDEPTDEQPAARTAGEEPADERAGGTEPGGRHRQRMLAIAALPAIVLASVLGAPGARAATASAGGSGGSCILFIICLPSPTSTPSPSPGSSASPQPSPGSPGPGSPSGSTGHRGKRGRAGRRADAGDGLVAATATSVITAGSATLDHLVYQGAASVPVAGGTVRMMKFTAASITLAGGVTATVTQGGTGEKGEVGGKGEVSGTESVTTLTTSPTLAFTGSVVLYATRLSGCLGALCVTLTPDNAVTLLLQLAGGVTGALTLTLTKVTTDQPVVVAGALQAGALKISFS